MSIIKAEYILIQDNLEKLKEILTGILKEIKALCELTKNLDIFWDGETNSAFVVALNEDLSFMELVMIALKDCIVLLNTALWEYQQLEGDIFRIIEDLKIVRI